MNIDRKHPDRGYLYERVAFSSTERALATHWEKWASKHSVVSLEGILGEKASFRDRYVAASVIQWLGSNVGFGFLIAALNEGGYYVEGKHATREANWRTENDTEPMVLAMLESQISKRFDECIARNASRAAQMQFDLCEPT